MQVVLTGGFAQFNLIIQSIAQVIGHLKGLANTRSQFIPLRPILASRNRAHLRSGDEKGTRFCPMIGAQINFLFAFPALPGAYAVGHSCLLSQDVHQSNGALWIYGRVACENLKRHDNKTITRQNRKRFAISTVHRGLAPPCVGIIKTGQIIMHQRGAVDTLQSSRCCIGQFRAIITASCGDTH